MIVAFSYLARFLSLRGLIIRTSNCRSRENLAAGFKALGDPHRVAVIHLLSAAPGPVCVVDIESHLPLSQSTVSYHLKTLVDAGVLDRERRGRWSYYTIQSERLTELSAALDRYRNVLAATGS